MSRRISLFEFLARDNPRIFFTRHPRFSPWQWMSERFGRNSVTEEGPQSVKERKRGKDQSYHAKGKREDPLKGAKAATTSE